jgi:hypothetical protein
MKNIYLYLDDEREPHIKLTSRDTLIICRTYNAAVATIKSLEKGDNFCLTLDLDHDLGTKKTGYDFCKWLIENGYNEGKFHCHTMNVAGRKNMRQLLLHYGWTEF